MDLFDYVILLCACVYAWLDVVDWFYYSGFSFQRNFSSYNLNVFSEDLNNKVIFFIIILSVCFKLTPCSNAACCRH